MDNSLRPEWVNQSFRFDYDYMRGCQCKIPYQSYETARQAAGILPGLEVYECKFFNHLHIGHNRRRKAS